MCYAKRISAQLANTMPRLLCWLVASWVSVYAQGSDSLQFVAMPQHGYTQIANDSEANLYLIQPQRNWLMKRYANSHYDSVQIIGGKGSLDEGFIHLTELSVQNRQALYLLDEGQRSVILLNTNLKVSEKFSFLETDSDNEIIPRSFDVSAVGDLYVLNDLDNSVHKYVSSQHNIIFGGNTYGEGSLESPLKIRVSAGNTLLVGQANGTFKCFDLYGIYQNSLTPNFAWKDFCISEKYILLWNDHEYICYDPMLQRTRWRKSFDKDKIVSLSLLKDRTVILGVQGIYVFE